MSLIARATFVRSALAAVLGTSLFAGLVAPASADPLQLPPCFYNGKCKLNSPKKPLNLYKPGWSKDPNWSDGPNWGYGAAALTGGLALGVLAASASQAQPISDDDSCYTVKRRARDEDGNFFYRRVRVCD